MVTLKTRRVRFFLDIEGVIADLAGSLAPLTLSQVMDFSPADKANIEDYMMTTVGLTLEQGISPSYLNYLFWKLDNYGLNSIEKSIFRLSSSPLRISSNPLNNNKQMWSELSKYHYSDKIVLFLTNNVESLDCIRIITDPTRHAVTSGKKAWISKNYPNLLDSIIFNKDRSKYAFTPGEIHILIDSRTANVAKWTEHGGYAILHSCLNPENTFSEVAQIVLNIANGIDPQTNSAGS